MESNEKPTPIWKKEISFRRKPAAEQPAEAGTPVPEPTAEVGEPAAPKSIWKKEVSLRKKAKPSAPEAAPVEAKADAIPLLAPDPLHELALEAIQALDAEPEPVPAPVQDAQPEPRLPEPAPGVVHDWLTKPLEEVSEPPAEPVEVEPVLEAEPAVVQEPALAEQVAPEPVAEERAGEEPVVPEIEALDPAVAEELLAEVAAEAVEVDLPQATLAPEVEAELELPPLDDAELAGLAELLAASDVPPATLPDVDPEPVEAAPAAEAVAKVPFYKRELSVKRAPRERKPKAERPKRERAPKADAGEKTPFYKRELSLKRGAKQWDDAEPATDPKPKKVKTARDKTPKDAKQPKQPKQPRERKQLSLPKLRGPAVAKASLPAGKGAKKLVGLKIGASQLAAARVVNGTQPELVQVAREALEAGIVVGGELRDPDALAVALKDFFRRHKLPKRGVRLGIANNRIGVRTFEVSGIDDPKQLANAIRFRAQEVLPIPIEEAVLDYQILSESTDESGVLTRRVLLVVAYRELVDRYVHACRKAGIEIVGIDLEAFALLRALAEPRAEIPGDERGALVAVSVGHDRSTFAVSDGRNCEFTRVLEWGGWALNVAIARALDIAPSEAEPVKRALSFTGTEHPPEGYDESQLEVAREAARKQLQSFARELVSSLQFYQNQPESLGIGEIVLTGGTTHLPGFAGELQRLIGVPVRVGDPLARVKVSKRIREHDQSGSFAIAIGLGIED